MTGILAAIPGAIALNRVYGAGLYGPIGVDTSPVSRSRTNVASPFTENWIGYFRPPTTATYTIGVQAIWVSDSSEDQYSRGYVWIGDTAISGYTTGNALASANNSYGTGNISLIAGLYYPIRIQWQAYIPEISGFFSSDDTTGTITFYSNGSTNVSNQIFYNTLTNGF